jgi:hypothetical protein
MNKPKPWLRLYYPFDKRPGYAPVALISPILNSAPSAIAMSEIRVKSASWNSHRISWLWST